MRRLETQQDIDRIANEQYRMDIRNGSGRCPGCGDKTSFGIEDQGDSPWCHPCKKRYTDEERLEIKRKSAERFIERQDEETKELVDEQRRAGFRKKGYIGDYGHCQEPIEDLKESDGW